MTHNDSEDEKMDGEQPKIVQQDFAPRPGTFDSRSALDAMLADNFLLESAVKAPADASIASVTVPVGWQSEERTYLKEGHVVRYYPHDGSDLAFGIMETGRPVSAAAQADFDRMLSANKDIRQPKALTPDEISKLSEVLGRTTLGDNQYSNNHRPPHPQSPSFNIESAQWINVNGRTVLEVKGTFVDYNGAPVNHYCGIFSPSSDKGITQAFIETHSRDTFNKSDATYRQIIDSIRWR
jgi:hypothetical protein